MMRVTSVLSLLMVVIMSELIEVLSGKLFGSAWGVWKLFIQGLPVTDTAAEKSGPLGHLRDN